MTVEQLTTKKDVTDPWSYYLQVYIMQHPDNCTIRQTKNPTTGQWDIDERWFELSSQAFMFEPTDAPALIPRNLLITTSDAISIIRKMTNLED